MTDTILNHETVADWYDFSGRTVLFPPFQSGASVVHKNGLDIHARRGHLSQFCRPDSLRHDITRFPFYAQLHDSIFGQGVYLICYPGGDLVRAHLI